MFSTDWMNYLAEVPLSFRLDGQLNQNIREMNLCRPEPLNLAKLFGQHYCLTYRRKKIPYETDRNARHQEYFLRRFNPILHTVSANGGWWLEITLISLQRVSAMSICHFCPTSAFRFVHVQIILVSILQCFRITWNLSCFPLSRLHGRKSVDF